MTEEQRTLLGETFLFKSLTDTELAPYCQNLSTENFAAGEKIYSQTNFRSAVAVLLAGEARVQSGEGVLLNRLGPGDCFGVAAVFHPVEQFVTVVTAVTPVTLVSLSHRWLETLFAEQPQTAVDYISFLSQKICFLNRKIDSFTAGTAEETVELWLTRHALGGRVEVSSGYTALAKELNLGRASLYRALDALVAAGKITRTGKIVFMNERRNLA